MMSEDSPQNQEVPASEDRLSPEEELLHLRQENEELKSFAFMACHDLQAPLRHISLYIDNLRVHLEKSDVLRDSETDYGMSVIESGAQKMTALIDNLMTLSMVEKRPLYLEDVDLNRLCAKVLTTVLEGLPDSENCNIKWGRLPTVRGDREELFQVLMNLCSNSLKFRAPKITPAIQISGRETEEFWEITVDDNGLGVDTDEQDSIFAPFTRSQSTDDFPGTGLGLTICQKIIHRHGGELWVTAKKQGGSAFHFTLAKDLANPPLRP